VIAFHAAGVMFAKHEVVILHNSVCWTDAKEYKKKKIHNVLWFSERSAAM